MSKSSYTKQQQAEYARGHYLKNKERYAESSRLTKQRCRDRLAELKEANPCADCGQFYRFRVMDYDHIGTDKIANVSTLVHKGNWSDALVEIEKCELVCANCHRTRTYMRRSGLHPSSSPMAPSSTG